MTTSDPLIQLDNVSRKFRVRGKSRLYLLSLLGFDLGNVAGQDFWAVRNVSLTIPRGMRLGIIGRNGAGKSTLLKLIAGILAPSDGRVRIKGRVETLMQLGAGFHPEFSGRDNVIGSLAYRGVTGRDAQRLTDEIIEFAELEEFQHNQLKTYSSGMAARLGFSAATAIAPEILIIDEILGAGDAYFASKSFDRMRQLTTGGATVLFVSHDMGSVELLCDEALWLERGRIRDMGATSRLSKAYAREIREREKQRLKARNAALSVAAFRAMRARQDRPLQFITRTVPLDKPVFGHRCALRAGRDELAYVRIGDAQDIAVTEEAAVVLDRTSSRWGPPMVVGGQPARQLAAESDAAGMAYFNLSIMEPGLPWSVVWTLSGGPARIEAFDGSAYRFLGEHPGGDVASADFPVPRGLIATFLASEGFEAGASGIVDEKVAEASATPLDEVILPDHATGEIALTQVDFQNAAGGTTHLFSSFESMTVRLRYAASRMVRDAVFVVCFYRDGVCALQTLSAGPGEETPPIEAGATGEAVLTIPSLPLGRGLYLVSVAIFPKAIYHERDGDYSAYVLLDRQFQIRVEQPEGGLVDLGIARGRCDWSISDSGNAA